MPRRAPGAPGAPLPLLPARRDAADLHLVIEAPEELQGAVRAPTTLVSGQVEARARLGAERVRDESLRRQLRPAEIAPRQPDAPDAELARDPHRHRRQLPPEHVRLSVGDWPADRNDAIIMGAIANPEDGVDRGFRRAIEVTQLDAQLREDPVQRAGRERFPAREDSAQAPAGRQTLRVQPHVQERRNDLDHTHSILGDRLREILGVPVQARLGQDHLRARQQRRVELPDRGVEADRSPLQDPVATRRAGISRASMPSDCRWRGE